MKIRYILLLLTVASLLGSCAAPKVAYFTDLKPGMAEQVLNPLEIRVRPEDKISILVNSKDPLLMDLFNLPIISRQIGIRSEASNNQGMSGYTINKDGNIDFPVLGHIHVAGMTREEIALCIKEELISKNLVKDPVVTVRFQNFRIQVLGEVNRPGSYNITSDQVTLFEALALAGDLTIHGRRNRVAVVRETDGVRTILYHDLRSRDVFNSPDFYLQQNDLVYVEPNRVRAEASTQNQFTNVGTWLSLISFLMSTCVLIFK